MNARCFFNLAWGDGASRRLQSRSLSRLRARWDSYSLVGARRWASSGISQEHSTFAGCRRMTKVASKSEWGALP